MSYIIHTYDTPHALTRDERLSELVSVVGGSVGCVNEDLLRAGQRLGVLEGGVLVGLAVAVQPQVAHAVA